MSGWGPQGGPAVGRLLHRVLAALFLIAFASLWSQLDLLFGESGLAPIAPGLSNPELFWSQPSLFFVGATDAWLHTVAIAGVVISLASLVGLAPRVCAPILSALYLGYAGPGEPFLSFQWDNLLIETGFLAAFVSRDRTSRLAHLLIAALAIKLYFESGVAKMQWGGEQWEGPEAMSYYYETSPIPSVAARWFHALPSWWHEFEGRGIVFIELFVPWLFLGPRRARLAGLTVLTGFQAINIATANYGFFVYVSVALHLVMLDDTDVARARALVLRLFRRSAGQARLARAPGPFAIALTAGYAAYWLAGSLIDGRTRFAPESSLRAYTRAYRTLHAPFRTANTYHLFGPITTRRIEVEFQALSSERWTPLHLHYKPGPLRRAPPIVQPHQPRVDFQLWFYGLSHRRGTPGWVRNLLDDICHEPQRVQQLFVHRLPRATAVRMVFWRYTFATGTADVWERERVAETRPLPCRQHLEKQGS